MFPAASPQPFIQPSSKRFHIMECAGLVDESSQQTSNLAWYGCMRSAWDSAQRKFDAKVSEGKSLSSILTTVSRTERVSDSPCQGRATKVNSQVYDLMPSRPPESRSVPMSVREATNLETTLRGAMESYNFQLWIVTALFRFLGDSGCCLMDDPLLDHFQRSFSRGAENLAAALASSTALVSAKRRESFLTHMFPSVTRTPRNASSFLIPCLTRRTFLRLPLLRLPAKRHEISPCTGGPNLAPPRRRAHISDDASTRTTPGAVTIRLPVPHHKTHGTHHLLQAVSSRGRSPPIPPGNAGVFGGRSLPPRPT